MRIAVMGAGGVGGYFGAQAGAAGHDVTFVARGAHLAAMRERGPADRERARRRCTSRAPAPPTIRRSWRPSTWCCSRSSCGTSRAPRRGSRRSWRDGGVVIPFQNGVESRERSCARVLGPDRVLGGVAYIAATIARAGRDRAHGHDGAAALRRVRRRLGEPRRSVRRRRAGGRRRCRARRRTSGARCGRSSCSSAALSGCTSRRAAAGRRASAPIPICARRSRPRCARPWRVGRARGVALADDYVAAADAVPRRAARGDALVDAERPRRGQPARGAVAVAARSRAWRARRASRRRSTRRSTPR